MVKYSKDWQRLGQASLYGANTTVPFDAGSLRMDEYGGYLYIRTCHEMYTNSDGLNHQANLTMAVRQSDMSVTDSYYEVMNTDYGYVSHSFNQFILVDEQGRIVTLDHGDCLSPGHDLHALLRRRGQREILRLGAMAPGAAWACSAPSLGRWAPTPPAPPWAAWRRPAAAT